MSFNLECHRCWPQTRSQALFGLAPLELRKDLWCKHWPRLNFPWHTCKFINYFDIFIRGRSQTMLTRFLAFLTTNPSLLTFSRVGKNSTTSWLLTYPPLLVNVVFGCPLMHHVSAMIKAFLRGLSDLIEIKF